jgi:hypothetical protein
LPTSGCRQRRNDLVDSADLALLDTVMQSASLQQVPFHCSAPRTPARC